MLLGGGFFTTRVTMATTTPHRRWHAHNNIQTTTYALLFHCHFWSSCMVDPSKANQTVSKLPFLHPKLLRLHHRQFDRGDGALDSRVGLQGCKATLAAARRQRSQPIRPVFLGIAAQVYAVRVLHNQRKTVRPSKQRIICKLDSCRV